MARIDLDVAFTDRAEAKQLGARWDSTARVWFVPDGVDPEPFRHWMTVPVELNVRSPSYFLASSTHDCSDCGGTTKVFGFILPAGHSVLNGDEFEDEWETSDEPTLLCDIAFLVPSVARVVATLAPGYRPSVRSVGAAESWINFCEHCGTALDDREVFCEPGRGFLAFSEEDARRIALLAVQQEFGAICGSFSIGVSLIEEMSVF